MEAPPIAHVMETDAVGHVVTFLNARDPDNDTLWYYIQGKKRFESLEFLHTPPPPPDAMATTGEFLNEALLNTSGSGWLIEKINFKRAIFARKERFWKVNNIPEELN